MSKRKMNRFRLKNGETLFKKGGMNYHVLGGYGHAVMGDAYLTDRRFYFGGNSESGEYLFFELPLSEIYGVFKAGIPVLTRSIILKTDGKEYRLTAFPVGGWYKTLSSAVKAARERPDSDGDGR